LLGSILQLGFRASISEEENGGLGRSHRLIFLKPAAASQVAASS
jgi:hypothetical protein